MEEEIRDIIRELDPRFTSGKYDQEAEDKAVDALLKMIEEEKTQLLDELEQKTGGKKERSTIGNLPDFYVEGYNTAKDEMLSAIERIRGGKSE